VKPLNQTNHINRLNLYESYQSYKSTHTDILGGALGRVLGALGESFAVQNIILSHWLAIHGPSIGMVKV